LAAASQGCFHARVLVETKKAVEAKIDEPYTADDNFSVGADVFNVQFLQGECRRTAPPRMKSNAPTDECAAHSSVANMIRYCAARSSTPDIHLKELNVEHVGPNREMVVGGQRLINLASTAFLSSTKTRA